MILSGLEIKKRMGHTLNIEPYKESLLNPNSYNLRLGSTIMEYYVGNILDPKKDNLTSSLEISEGGFVLNPGRLYLAETLEYTETYGVVPFIEGRSSVGRLGIFVHITAGFGDVGFCGKWTLEITPVRPVRIYAGMEICQISYHTIEGEYISYDGKYQGSKGVAASKFHEEYAKD